MMHVFPFIMNRRTSGKAAACSTKQLCVRFCIHPNRSSNTTYIERHELRRPGVERERGLTLVDVVASEDPPVLHTVGGPPVPAAVPARRGPGIEVIGVARDTTGHAGTTAAAFLVEATLDPAPLPCSTLPSSSEWP